MTIDPSSSSDTSQSPAGRNGALAVAVVGLGARGATHTALAGTLPGCELVAVADVRGGPRRELRGLGHKVPAFSRLDTLLHKVTPDAVFVSVPLASRPALVRAALEAGCAVFSERPLAPTAEATAELVALAASTNAPLAVSCPLLFEPVFDAARRALRLGAIGRVSDARASMNASRVFGARDAARMARLGRGGVLAQMSAELLSLLLVMFGVPSTVSATASRLYGDLEDEMHAMMSLADGTEVGFDSSWSAPGHPRPATVIELAGEGGRLLVSDDALELDLTAVRGGFPAGHTRRRATELDEPARFDLGGEARWLEDAAFARWAQGGEAPLNTGAQALLTQRVIEALYASVETQGAPAEVRA
jgi:predicted dehydrogenase